jgi:hypothetical protein
VKAEPTERTQEDRITSIFMVGKQATLQKEVIRSQKRWFTYGLHRVISQKMAAFICTTARTIFESW